MRILKYGNFMESQSQERFDVIESRFVYSNYCPVWFTGTRGECDAFIHRMSKTNPGTYFETRPHDSVAESENKEPKEFPKNWLTLYADAGFKDGMGTYGIWLRGDGGTREILSGKCPPEVDDNTAAEVYAICQGMHKGLRRWPGTKGFYVRSDSQAALNILKTGGNGKREIINRLYSSFSKMVEDYSLEINFKWVKGHRNPQLGVKAYINNRVDQLATDARKRKD